MKNKTVIEHSDEGLLERMVIVRTHNPAFDAYTDMQNPMTLLELYHQIGLWGFVKRFVDRDYSVGIFNTACDGYFQHKVELDIVDFVSGKLIHPVGVLRAINRLGDMDLYRFRPKKSYSGCRWRRSRYFRRRYVIAVKAQACGGRDKDEFEPGIRKGYLRKVKDAFSSPRSDVKDRCWKRSRKNQYK